MSEDLQYPAVTVTHTRGEFGPVAQLLRAFRIPGARTVLGALYLSATGVLLVVLLWTASRAELPGRVLGALLLGLVAAPVLALLLWVWQARRAPTHEEPELEWELRLLPQGVQASGNTTGAGTVSRWEAVADVRILPEGLRIVYVNPAAPEGITYSEVPRRAFSNDQALRDFAARAAALRSAAVSARLAALPAFGAAAPDDPPLWEAGYVLTPAQRRAAAVALAGEFSFVGCGLGWLAACLVLLTAHRNLWWGAGALAIAVAGTRLWRELLIRRALRRLPPAGTELGLLLAAPGLRVRQAGQERALPWTEVRDILPRTPSQPQKAPAPLLLVLSDLVLPVPATALPHPGGLPHHLARVQDWWYPAIGGVPPSERLDVVTPATPEAETDGAAEKVAEIVALASQSSIFAAEEEKG